MTKTTCHITVSVDGFVAGPNQSPENPLGEGGEDLHQWMVETSTWRKDGGERTPDDDMVDEILGGIGAFIMGRNMFGGGPGPWEESWTGWWGEDPPYHAPVFVLTHYPREPVKMPGGTTYHFVTDGIESALSQAKAAAGDKMVAIAGGAQAVQQYLRAGLLDELTLHISPICLGSGERLLENVGNPVLEPIRVIASPKVTHVTYRVG
ncbi:deaminase reductase [Lentzea sp. NBRC 105346]|uniref:dihydrofolate reductase family protein n=1 Tax=Lentzea sp. NBRC 105346 TaxID=3032205 RepID=UPI0024A29948|nr:dihydrofolate reductase family protein [Lentzea sp. NBRC 105346]GLZ35034.1 deaminase reductase [Lentzea sp. NBRC 105346]